MGRGSDATCLDNRSSGGSKSEISAVQRLAVKRKHAEIARTEGIGHLTQQPLKVPATRKRTSSNGRSA